MTDVVVTAYLDTPTAGIEGTEFPLDGPLAWAAAVSAPPGVLEPITAQFAPDVDLPLEKWELHGTWGWCVSRARYDITARSQVARRRRPPDAEFALFTPAKRHHHGLGPYKARDTAVPVAVMPTIRWQAKTTDEARLRELLALITHLGGHRAVGLGHVTSWTVEPGTPGGWRDRRLPAPGVSGRFRPPYWHATREVVGQ